MRAEVEARRPKLAVEVINPVLKSCRSAQLSLGQADAALRTAREATRIVRALYGEDSGKESESLLVGPDALLTLNRTQEAVRVSARATELARQVYDEDHLSTAYAIRSWGTALPELGETAAATQKLRAAKALFTNLGVTLEADKTEFD